MLEGLLHILNCLDLLFYLVGLLSRVLQDEFFHRVQCITVRLLLIRVVDVSCHLGSSLWLSDLWAKGLLLFPLNWRHVFYSRKTCLHSTRGPKYFIFSDAL